MDIVLPDLARRKRRRIELSIEVAVEPVLLAAFSLNFLLCSHMNTDSIGSMNIPTLFSNPQEGSA